MKKEISKLKGLVPTLICLATLVMGTASLSGEQRYYGTEVAKLNDDLSESMQEAGKDRGKMLQLSLDNITKQLALMTEFKKSSEESAEVLKQGMERAQYYLDWISLEKGIESSEYKAAKSIFDGKVKEFDAKKAENDAAIVAKAKPPADIYKGADKEKLKSMIKAEWIKAYPDEKILAVRFPKETWERRKERTWYDSSNSWVDSDMSYYYAGVIIKLDDKMAMVYTAVANKNNLSGQLSIGVQTKESFTSYKILLSSLK